MSGAADDLLAHRLEGAGGEVVLLLNGGMMTYPGSWEPLRSALLTDHRLLGCDFRGQLRSPGEASPRLADHAADLVALLDALGLDAVHVLGTSFGAEVGLLLAALHPQRVRTLAAVAAADRSTPALADDARRLAARVRDVLAGGDRGGFHDQVVAEVYSPAYRAEQAAELAARREQLAALPDAWFRGLLGILAAVAGFDLTPWLERIACPTLVVGAAADRVMPAERVAALAAAIAGAELAVHPTAGHVLVAEDPGWLLATYRAFLARHASDAGAAVPMTSEPV